MTSGDMPPASAVGQCRQVWRSDPTRRCNAHPVEPGGPCLAHHPDWASLVERSAAEGKIVLADCEISDALLADLVALLAGHRDPGVLVDLRGATFIDYALFRHSVRFSGVASFAGATFAGGASFAEAKFADVANFNGAKFADVANFDGAEFSGEALFEDAEFYGEASFIRHATFSSGARFDRAQFGGVANFDGAEFDGWARFEQAKFKCDASFLAATFTDQPVFDEATFSGAAYFQLASFGSSVGFTDAMFERDARFDFASFNREVSFGRCKPGAVVVLREPRLNGPATILLAGSTVAFESLLLREALTLRASYASAVTALVDSTLLAPLTIGEGVTLTHASLRGTTGLDQVRLLSDPKWRVRWGRRTLADESTVRDQHAMERTTSGGRTGGVLREYDHAEPPAVAATGASNMVRLLTYDQVETLYRQLRVGLEASKAAPAAADFYYGEMEMRQRATNRRSIERSLLLVYKWVGGYGVRAWRPLATYLVVIAATVAAIVNPRVRRLLLGAASTIDQLHVDRVPGALAFVLRNSTSVFQAPATELTGLGTTVFVVERFVAVSLLALFVLALRSKVQR